MTDQETKRRGSISDLSNNSRKSLESFVIKGTNTHFAELLKAHTINELKPQNIVELDTSVHTAMSGFQVLLNKHLLSAPVWDPSVRQYIGFLHVRDLVSCIMHSVKSTRARARSVSMAPPNLDEIQSEAKFNHAEDWMKHAELSISKKINDPTLVSQELKYLARRNPFHPVSGTETLYEAARLLSGTTHRMPVLNQEGRVVRLVTQSSIVHFLAEHIAELKDEANQTVEGTSIGLREVVSARGDRPALEAFLELDNHGLSGVAVVTRDGTIAGNTSAQDLRYFLLDKGTLSLDMNLLDYLAAIRQQDVSASDRAPVCSVGPQGTLGRIIGLLSATGYHRVYVVDARQCKPIGVVSLTDILKYATATNYAPLNPPETRQTRHSISESRISSSGGRMWVGDQGRSRSPSTAATKSLDLPGTRATSKSVTARSSTGSRVVSPQMPVNKSPLASPMTSTVTPTDLPQVIARAISATPTTTTTARTAPPPNAPPTPSSSARANPPTPMTPPPPRAPATPSNSPMKPSPPPPTPPPSTTPSIPAAPPTPKAEPPKPRAPPPPAPKQT